jgi:proteasome lid subunit RPN8/RPN11
VLAKLALDAAPEMKRHALEMFPDEACGILTPDGYVPCPNIHPTPGEFFRIPVEYQRRHQVLACFHSHPNGRDEPSTDDMQAQIDAALPYGLCACDGQRTTEPWFWGPGIDPPPYEGRTFRHGPSGTDGKGDCYALIKDWYKGEWGIDLPEWPRDNEWWKRGRNHYLDLYTASGFVRLPADVRPLRGDLALARIGNLNVPTHGAIYLGDGLILHHLPNRLSTTDPCARWMRQVVCWIRHSQAPTA